MKFIALVLLILLWGVVSMAGLLKLAFDGLVEIE